MLFATWIAASAALITAGDRLDGWMNDEAKREFAAKITARLRADPQQWAQSVNQLFLGIFDWIYGWRRPRLARLLWRGIVCSYLILLLARLVLYLFRLPVPGTEAILSIAVIFSVLMCLFSEALTSAISLGRRFAHARELELRHIAFDGEVVSVVLCGSSAFGFSVAVVAVVTRHLGTALRVPIAMGVGTALGFCVALLLFRMSDIPVSPVRAFVSSILMVFLLASAFPAAATVFLGTLRGSGWMALTYIAFNFFGDAVSLVETRWVLRKARGAALATVASLLLVDLIASAAVYLVLPGLAHESFDTLRQGVFLRGTQPWLGVLFWSTFATSALFYVFVLAVLLLKVLAPVVKMVNLLDTWFSLYEHPARLLSLSAIIVLTIAFGLVGLLG